MHLVQTKKAAGLALLMIDLDHFKNINDKYGHDTGDAALQHAANVISGCIRAGDFIFRYGGEEFLLCLSEASTDTACRIAENIRSRLESSPLSVKNGGSLAVTASIGVSVYNGHPDYQYMITQADAALYKAKNEGRNCVRFG